MPDKIVLFGKPGCSMVAPVRRLLRDSDAEFEYVNIAADPGGKARVRGINDGYESVPTVILPDGSTPTEPTLGELKVKLKALGYQISATSAKRTISLLLNTHSRASLGSR